MAILLQAKNLSYALGEKQLFQQLDLVISQHDKIGLVGYNGAGKTSLLKLLCGQSTPDEGHVMTTRGLTISLVEQFVPTHLENVAVFEAVASVLTAQMRQTDEYKVSAILRELGFTPKLTALKVRSLSGGQQNLLLFARARLRQADLMLMDEPGNHMDVLALTQLKRYLLATARLTYLIISHDRDLLDACCSRTVFLRDLGLLNFDLPFSAARTKLQQHDQQAQTKYAHEAKEIQRIRTSSKRLAHWGRTYDNEDLARKAKTMALRADKLEDKQTFVSGGNPLNLKLSAQVLRSKTIVTLDSAKIYTPDKALLLLTTDLLVVKPGDRIGLLGANGSGKSTTIRRILEAQNSKDEKVRFNPNVSVGYFEQELDDLNQSTGRFDWLYARVDKPNDDVKRALVGAGIRYQDLSQPVNTLSGGEKARMVFLSLFLRRPSIMILDEPTNHIDLQGREQLEEQLVEADVTLLVTSHDKHFLQTVCTKYWAIRDNRLREISHIDEFYTQLASQYLDSAQTETVERNVEVLSSNQGLDEELALERIGELEDLLRADKLRKVKFQKPKLQQQWQVELNALWKVLEDST